MAERLTAYRKYINRASTPSCAPARRALHDSVRSVAHQNWKLTLSYDGTGFHGWQVQPARPTVQGTLQAALARLTGEQVLPQGSGRTDAGVHALAQVASFTLAAEIPPANLQRALNRALPPSIRVLATEHAAADFHARYSAVGKTYEYRVFDSRFAGGEAAGICSPFVAPYVWDCPWPLDLERMQVAAATLVGEHDFASFAAADPDRAERRGAKRKEASTVRKIYSSTWDRGDEWLTYRISGSGFLHHMVRNIVGTLVEVGRGAVDASDMQRIVAAGDRSAAGPTAPASGLFLVAVDYGEPA